jgi:phosphate-selective porin OprO/OprP
MVGIVGLLVLDFLSPLVRGQDESFPSPPPVDVPALPSPTVPPSALLPGVPDLAPATPREAQLERRIQQLESMVQQLSQQIPVAPPVSGGFGTPPAAGSAGAGRTTGGTGVSPGVAASTADDTAANVGGSVASRGPLSPAPSSRFNMPSNYPKSKLNANFGPGFEFMTDDEEYQLQFHDLTQIDYRGLWDTPRNTTADQYESTFGLPRQWWIFSGRMTKPFEYFVVPAFGFDNIQLLDGFLNVNFDTRLQLKIGRYKTPFTYEFYNLPINGLINPERSLWFNNFGLNRDVGMMAWGSLFDKRFDYAIGIFNGDRNYFIDRNSSKDVAGLVNFRPFGNAEGSPLENFSFGGSVLAGNQFSVPVPKTFRTNVATTGTGFVGVPFLSFDNGIIESGNRALWDIHAAWYYRGLSLIAEWGSGMQDYAPLASAGKRTRLPTSGYYVQAGYFLTGETVQARGQLKPLHNFDIRRGKFGLGAVELAARYSTLEVGDIVFTNQLANPQNWTDEAYTIDVGVNWYWTQFVKVYMGWQGAVFGKPVLYGPDQYQLTNDMLWARFQVAF